MNAREGPDPVRTTLVAILQQLNRAESMHEGVEQEQALELGVLERLLADLWAIEHGGAKVPMVLGLLLRNGLVRVDPPVPNPRGSARPRPRYRITAQGKQFLVEALAKSDRIA
jgi:hypothetical protein